MRNIPVTFVRQIAHRFGPGAAHSWSIWSVLALFLWLMLASMPGGVVQAQTVKLTASPSAILRPDLVVSDLSVGSITRNANGSFNIPVSFTVRNTNSVTAPATGWYDLAYLSANGVFDDNSVVLGYDVHWTALEPGDSYTVTRTYITSAATAGGTYTLIVKADGHGGPVSGSNTDTGSLPEGSEDNNTRSSSILLPLPDLVVGEATVGAITRNANGSYTIPVRYTVSNLGSGAAPASGWYDLGYLSHNGELDATAQVLSYDGHWTLLEPGSSYTVERTYITSTTEAGGNYFLILKADGHGGPVSGSNLDNGSLIETLESNNTKALPITLTLPDLLVSGAQAGPITRNANGSYNIPVSFTVKNVGTSAAPSTGWYDLGYLSQNGELDATAQVLGYDGHWASLEPGSSYTVEYTYVTSTTVAGGNYFLILKADGHGGPVSGSNLDGGSLIETIESNNTKSLPIALTLPDLVITGAEVGQITRRDNGAYDIPVSFTVKNMGSSAAPAAGWYDLGYLSLNGELDAASVVLGYDAHYALVEPGASYVVNRIYTTAPATAEGNYTLILKADGHGGPVSGSNTDNGSLPESNDSNNSKSLSISLSSNPASLPDLTLTWANIGHIASNADGSSTITASYTIRSGGAVAASGGWNTVGYLSRSGVLDADAVMIGACLHAGTINPGYGSVDHCAFTTTQPLDGYKLILKADGHGGSLGGSNTDGGFIPESNENNNTLVLELAPARGVDLAMSNAATGVPQRNADGTFSFPVSFSVTNSGTTSLSDDWYDMIFLSRSGVLDENSTLLWQQYHDCRSEGGPCIDKGTSYPGAATVQIPADVPLGHYSLIFKTDARTAIVGGGRFDDNGNIAEANEANNVRVVPVTLALPDLLVSSATIGTVHANTDGSFDFPLTFTVKNEGDAAASGGWRDMVFLSSNGVLDANSQYLDLVVRVPELAAGASYTVSKTITTPASVARGNYALIIKADGHAPFVTGGSHTDNGNVGETNESNNTLSRAITLSVSDMDGPQISNVTLAGAPLGNGTTVTRSSTMTLSATDPSGIARVEIVLDGVVVATARGSDSYSAQWSLDSVANGAHVLAVRATDSFGNVSTSSFNILVAHAAPVAPAISTPASGQITRYTTQAVSGTAAIGSKVQVLVNEQAQGAPVNVSNDGRFNASVTLVSGVNRISASATDQYGTSAQAASVAITLDQTVPASPSSLAALAQAAGKVRLSWSRSTDVNAVSYDLYRAANEFATIEQAQKLNTAPLTITSYDDLPQQDRTWFYRVVAINAAGTPSLPSNSAQATSDNSVPRALSIAYTALGKTDPATGRIGQGRVNLVLTSSEALPATPYLAIVPQGGAPIAVELLATSATTYAGSFVVDANTPAGVANALYSARDAAGNRGTEIDAGATLKIDTQGPVLSNIVLTPASPVKNEGNPLLSATFTFSKAPTGTPKLKYALSGAGRIAQPLASLSQLNATTWSASFNLPGDAGQSAPETLSFSVQAQDDLDNISTKVAAANRFQVYQGNLPPLLMPFGFSAKALPGGKVKLNWEAVDEAFAYQVYRQAPGQSELQPLARSGGLDYLDTTPQDGTYQYAVASVRQSNGQQAVSGVGNVIEVQTRSSAPAAPQALALQLTGQGIYASWQAPSGAAVDYYNLYRASGLVITSIEGLTPIKTRIKTPQVIDTNPSPSAGAYVVTAVDAVGNESAISNSAYLNASLLPVRNLTLQQNGNDLPQLSWQAPNSNLAGYLVYVANGNTQTKLTPSPISGTSFVDSGYAGGERRYSVASVDSSNVELARNIVLPALNVQIISGLPLKRGVMNRLQVQVTNNSATTLDGLRAVLRLATDRDGTQFKLHKSEPVTLAANQTVALPVVVGGYDTLAGAPQVQLGVEITPNDGELVKLTQSRSVGVAEGALVVGMATSDFTRGGSGKLKLTIENTSEVDIELLTATNNGTNESSELRFKLLDGDGNVLATQPYKQVFGANVITLPNGQTVARIAAGSSYTSSEFALNVPAASPNGLRVRLEVDKLRYHSGQDDEVQIAGRGSEKVVSLLETAYTGEVTSVSPASSFGDEDVLISGRAFERSSQTPMPNSRLKLVLNQQGFERNFSVVTDGSGNFVYRFKPTLVDSGNYRVSAVHPEITDRPEQKSFTINRVTLSPSPFKLDIPKDYPYTVPFVATAGAGAAASNVRLVLNPLNQPTGRLPQGLRVDLPPAVSLQERQSAALPVVFSGNSEAQSSGSVILDVLSDEHASSPIGQVRIDYVLSEAKPYLVNTPSFVDTGLALGDSRIESVQVKNNGLQAAQNLKFTLTKPDGSAAPAWAGISSQADGTLGVGETRSVDLSLNPPQDSTPGNLQLKLTARADNMAAQSMPVYVAISQSGKGSAWFKAADIYTATLKPPPNPNGDKFLGLAAATITMQNEDVPTILLEQVTDEKGEVAFSDLPAGMYKFRARANNHQEVAGRLEIRPGVRATQPLFLNYNLVTVEWSVREIAIQDRYEIVLNATYETDVPAAVVVMQPASVNLPKMNVGDVYYGELSLTNYGLIRAVNITQTLPASDAFFRYEFLATIPTSLESKQRVTIPYRVVSLQPLERASNGFASGGGCFSYIASLLVKFFSPCAEGNMSSGSTGTSWMTGSNSSCLPGAPPTGTNSPVSNGPGGQNVEPRLGGGGGKGKKCVYIPRGSNCPT